MNKVLKDLPFVIAYLDDIIIYSKTAEDNLAHLQLVFHKLWNAKLSMKLNKCHFSTEEFQYLGHILRATGMKPLPPKVDTIQLMWPPRNAKHVWAFLGLVGYYENLLKNLPI